MSKSIRVLVVQSCLIGAHGESAVMERAQVTCTYAFSLILAESQGNSGLLQPSMQPSNNKLYHYPEYQSALSVRFSGTTSVETGICKATDRTRNKGSNCERRIC